MRRLPPHLEARTGRAAPGCTVVVVLVVFVRALRPRRRVMRVGFVVRVTVALLRLECMFAVFGSCFVVGVGVGVDVGGGM